MLDGVIWVLTRIGMGFVDAFNALTHPALWLDWSDKQALARFIYYGGSSELFFAVFAGFLALTVIGLVWSAFMWRLVRLFEGFANAIGRFFAWAGLLMVLQQILIVFLQRIFRVASIELGPFAPFGYPLLPGLSFERDLSWWSEELKLYNAMIVCLCVSYTFVQGGHVRVDLLYANLRFRAKRAIDMFGALVFMLPAATLCWLYAWFFMWRSLVTPKVSATTTLEQLMLKAKYSRWNIETIAFSPNGFDAYFLFKILILSYCGLIFIHAWAVFWRALCEFRGGPSAQGRSLDLDRREGDGPLAHAAH